ncbi:MAG: hypothetical protein KAX55_18340, partial [Propionivibrio sp.]|nr:hypothetical protein [Propionivibrio sp.]
MAGFYSARGWTIPPLPWPTFPPPLSHALHRSLAPPFENERLVQDLIPLSLLHWSLRNFQHIKLIAKRNWFHLPKLIVFCNQCNST